MFVFEESIMKRAFVRSDAPTFGPPLESFSEKKPYNSTLRRRRFVVSEKLHMFIVKRTHIEWCHVSIGYVQ